MTHQFIFSQLFDIKPLKEDGTLDLIKIEKVKKVLNFRELPIVSFAADHEMNRDALLAELAAIEHRENCLKITLSGYSPLLSGRRLKVKCQDEKIKCLLPINIIDSQGETDEREDYLNKSTGLIDHPKEVNPYQPPADKEFEEKMSKFFGEQERNESADDASRPVIEDVKEKTTNRSLAKIRRLFPTFIIVSLLAINLYLGKDFIGQSLIDKKINFSANTSGLLASQVGDKASFFENFYLIASFVKDYNILLKLLGFERSQKYLLIFQNNSEMRATGGFIGSYGILDMDRGKVKNFFVDDVYNVDGQLQEKIIPPAPILRVADFWSMHDANWFADFPTSAQKVAWFYEKTGGPTVDGVVSLTPTVVERLLKIMGPIELPDYGLTITSDNFVEEIQNKVEAGPDKALNQPKKVLVAFASKFFAKLQESVKNNWPAILAVFNQSLQEKHLLFYFSDQNLENFVLNKNWGGQVVKTDGDYLSVINSNLGGNKTDRVIEEKIEHSADIQTDGSVIDTIKISRYHRGGNTKYDWWNTPNIDYERVYVPSGSKLLNGGKGIESLEEGNKTVFAQWLVTSAGQTTTVEYKYLLPFKVSDKYSLLVQKQSGSLGSGLNSSIKNFTKEWKNESVLTEDRLYEVFLGQ